MVKLILLSWRHIPAQVIVQRGRKRKKAVLGQRFHEAIDPRCARARAVVTRICPSGGVRRGRGSCRRRREATNEQ
jgi:hypothetical protein